jgi:hypothetical protein
MKTTLCRLLACLAFSTATGWSQTVNWGSEVFSDLRDSNGVTLDDLFVFEIGAFADGFTPTEANTGEWLDNWYVFDRAGYNEAAGYFTGTTQMTDTGRSTSPWLSAPDGESFEGLDAFLWIRKGDQPVPGTEWLVVSAQDWKFPTAIPGCCDNELPVEFSVSDLSNEIPKWGRQGSIQGPGEYTVTSAAYTLQTNTFIPEPSAALLGLLSTVLLLRRRRPALPGDGG